MGDDRGRILYGGTFNPVHRGHVEVATTAATVLGIERVHLVLSARPPHRQLVPVVHRWAMLRLACAADARLVADDTEVRRELAQLDGDAADVAAARPSYTVDTLRALRLQTPDVPLYFLIGMDSLLTLASWYRWWRIVQLCHLVVLRRPGYRLDALLPPISQVLERRVFRPTASLPRPRGAGGRIVLLDAPMPDVSSSAIRRALGADRQAALADVPAAVADYIRSAGLYRDASG
ncbi:MAG: nicotinate-nucleotide adenylyltransferase [Pseudomonadota bacterium]